MASIITTGILVALFTLIFVGMATIASSIDDTIIIAVATAAITITATTFSVLNTFTATRSS